MPFRYVSAKFCEDNPEAYKLCSAGICVNLNSKCPCEMNVEFRCKDGDCIPLRQKCDGIKHCSGGEDELRCPGQMMSQAPPADISPTLLTIIISVGLLICVFVCLLIGAYLFRRHKNNTSRDSQSVTVPLQKKCVVEVTDIYDKCDKNIQSAVVNDSHGNEYKQNILDKSNDSHISVDSHEYKSYENWKNSQNKFWGNLGFPHKHNDIYALELENEAPGRVQKLGKYMFKPRLKSHDQDICVNPDDIQLNVALNSYRHFSGKISLAVNIDPEPETFASDLLCASTPRQPVKHLKKGTDPDSGKMSTNLAIKPNTEEDIEIL